jgi:tetratricopeptide (TPR) repeat protein
MGAAPFDKATRILTRISAALVLVALADLGLRAAVRLDTTWDAIAYHLPFAALRAGLNVPYDLNDRMKDFYLGFPPLPELVQGIAWRLTGSLNATGVVNYLAFACFLAACHFLLRAPYWLVALGALTAPMVLIHTTVSYVDLFGNSFLAIGVSCLLYLGLHPDRTDRAVLPVGLGGLVAAGWSKYQLVPVVAVILGSYAVVGGRRAGLAGFSRGRARALVACAALFAALPYGKNLVRYGNPFWPVRVPVVGALFPYKVDQREEALLERPPPLRDYSQARLFVHSLFEIEHPTHYDYRPRWTLDEGRAWIAFRMGGFWSIGVIVYLVSVTWMLIVCARARGAHIAACMGALLCFVAFLPQSHELRYYQFIPLSWSAAAAMLFEDFRERRARSAFVLLTVWTCSFVYMAYANLSYYRIERVDYRAAASAWGAAAMWGDLQPGIKYCAVDMMPIGFLLTGPTMSEYMIIDRSRRDLCPADSVVLSMRSLTRAERYLARSLEAYNAGNYRECVAASEKALAIRPGYAEAYNNMCAAYTAEGRWDEAVAACDRALELKPDFELARNNRAWATRSKAEQRQPQGGDHR